MANIFGNLKTEGIKDDGDRLGGNFVLETDSYTGKVIAFFAEKADSGALGVTIHVELQLPDNKTQKYQETIWGVTNKQGDNFYLDKKTGEKKLLPGFQTANSIALLTAGKELSELEAQEKVFNLYDKEAKREIAKSVPAFPEVIGEEITLAIRKKTVDKNVKNGAGEYVPSGDTIEQNSIEKVFRFDTKMTVTEIREEREQAEFHNAWVEKNKGKTRNEAKGTEGKTGTPGSAANPPAAGQKATTSLFGKK